MNLVFNARLVITDSGGIQEETTYLGIPCLTLRENTERPVTVTHGHEQAVRAGRTRCRRVERDPADGTRPAPAIEFWDGQTAERVVEAIRASASRDADGADGDRGRGHRRTDDAAGLEEAIIKLEAYCRSREWAGFDPYDALNSELFARTPLAKSRVARLALTQFLKRSPVNFRPLLGIQPHQNPKALALFLMSYVRRARAGDEASRATAASRSRIGCLELRSPGTPYWCWGYSFPWQMRHEARSSVRVRTSCARRSRLTRCSTPTRSDLATSSWARRSSAGEYIARELYWNDGQHAGFAYPLPDIRVPIHNANFLGAALLCRLAQADR